MPWWIDDEAPPGRIRALWVRNTRFLYRGPRAWLVVLNLGISCLTLFPYLLGFVVWLFAKHPIFRSDTDTLVGGFAYLFLGATSEIPYAPCGLMALPACWMLLVTEIPWRVRWVTAAIDLVACAQFVWLLHWLKAGFQYGPFGKP